MKGFPKSKNPDLTDRKIATIKVDENWIKKQRNKFLLIISITGLIVIVLSLIFQNITFAIIRGLIFTIVIFIVYYKPEVVNKYYIRFYRDGRIVVKRGLIKSEIFSVSGEKVPLVKKRSDWLIGYKKVKISIAAFPDLEKRIDDIRKLR